MKIVKQIIEALGYILPFLRKKNPQEMKEFTELVKSQYTYLMDLVERFQKDYFGLSEQVKTLYQEIAVLNKRLAEALALQCNLKDCPTRQNPPLQR